MCRDSFHLGLCHVESRGLSCGLHGHRGGMLDLIGALEDSQCFVIIRRRTDERRTLAVSQTCTLSVGRKAEDERELTSTTRSHIATAINSSCYSSTADKWADHRRQAELISYCVCLDAKQLLEEAAAAAKVETSPSYGEPLYYEPGRMEKAGKSHSADVAITLSSKNITPSLDALLFICQLFSHCTPL